MQQNKKRGERRRKKQRSVRPVATSLSRAQRAQPLSDNVRNSVSGASALSTHRQLPLREVREMSNKQ